MPKSRHKRKPKRKKFVPPPKKLHIPFRIECGKQFMEDFKDTLVLIKLEHERRNSRIY